MGKKSFPFYPCGSSFFWFFNLRHPRNPRLISFPLCSLRALWLFLYSCLSFVLHQLAVPCWILYVLFFLPSALGGLKRIKGVRNLFSSWQSRIFSEGFFASTIYAQGRRGFSAARRRTVVRRVRADKPTTQ